MKIKGKEAEVFDAKDGNLDTKKKLNRSKKEIKKEWIDEIRQDGLTIERLESLPVPVYRYQTQLTIHGVYKGDIERYINNKVGGYAALVKNKNQSVGVKYSAVDMRKKRLAGRVCRMVSKYQFIRSSNESCFYYISRDKDEALAEYNRIDENLFVGRKQIGYVEFFNFFFVKLDVFAIYKNNWKAFVKHLCNIEDIGLATAEYYAKQRQSDAEYEKERIQRAKEDAIKDAEQIAPYLAKDADKRVDSLDGCHCVYFYRPSFEIVKSVFYIRDGAAYGIALHADAEIPEKEDKRKTRLNKYKLDTLKSKLQQHQIFKAF